MQLGPKFGLHIISCTSSVHFFAIRAPGNLQKSKIMNTAVHRPTHKMLLFLSKPSVNTTPACHSTGPLARHLWGRSNDEHGRSYQQPNQDVPDSLNPSPAESAAEIYSLSPPPSQTFKSLTGSRLRAAFECPVVLIQQHHANVNTFPASVLNC
jgi:hypothetical protein